MLSGSILAGFYTPQMDTKRVSVVSVVLAAVAALIGAMLARHRPVKPPTHHGAWRPHAK